MNSRTVEGDVYFLFHDDLVVMKNFNNFIFYYHESKRQKRQRVGTVGEICIFLPRWVFRC